MRNELCPICGRESRTILQLHFNQKMKLPTEVPIRHCPTDNFLFVANGHQESYNEYYQTLANDSYHSEVAGGNLHSPIAQLQGDHLVKMLGDFFAHSRKVLDFGCGEGWLLAELASQFRSSLFWGVDPSPAAKSGSHKAEALGLSNLIIDREAPSGTSYDLVIASHVLEHLIDFDLINFWNSALADDALLYIEVPNSLVYSNYERMEFLYYFDRLHVNHFTPQSLAFLLAQHGFGYVGQLEYDFPYRDGRQYPALGMLFRKGGVVVSLSSANILEAAMRYTSAEQQRARAFQEQLKKFDGVLVWGAGDNFYRSSENGGPLSDPGNMIVLDKRPQVVTIGSRSWMTEAPADAIRQYPWPVVISVSEGRKSISRQVKEIDLSRQIFFL
jgi:2-polyprenyl-3-methyl-5-hydroxy-6-metoxy-1,4-benzoquinol methylase